jgi:hypothetical protein
MHLLVKQDEVQEVFLVIVFCIPQTADLMTGLLDYTLKNSLHVNHRFV